MATLTTHTKGYLVADFYYQGRRCREFLKLHDNRDNRRDAERFVPERSGPNGLARLAGDANVTT